MIDKEKYRTDGEFIGSSGIKLNIYYDFMEMLENDSELEEIIFRMKSESRLFNLIGMETFGGLVTAWAHKFNISSAYFLKERKHGNRKRLYGELKLNDNDYYPIFLLDDVITTGKTISEAVEYLRGHNILIDKIFALKSKLTKIKGIKVIVID